MFIFCVNVVDNVHVSLMLNTFNGTTVAPRYNAVVGVHEMEPRCKRGAL